MHPLEIPTIGVDFDNTLISYDDVMVRVAAERRLALGDGPRSKRDIRDALRRLPDGEMHWQRLQADVYGPRIGEGRLFEGVREFLEECRRRSAPVLIISHKTQYASAGDGATDLRRAALDWMRSQGFFDPGRFGIPESNVYFEPTRVGKAHRIERSGCSVFIDDLQETFLEPAFPMLVRKILFGAEDWPGGPPEVECASSWNEICDLVFTRPIRRNPR